MLRILLTAIIATAAIVPVRALDPMSTDYTVAECEGSAMPYPVPDELYELPDSLHPVFIDHVGRHGARYPTSAAAAMSVEAFLSERESTLTDAGKKLLALSRHILDISHNHWGDLDSLGYAEQVGIASRMFMRCPMLFNDTRIRAVSTYVPRCVMSMDAFTHQLTRLNNHIEVYANSGRQNDETLRPFDVNRQYLDWRRTKPASAPLDSFCRQILDPDMLRSLTGTASLPADWVTPLLDSYQVVSGCSAMGLPFPEGIFNKGDLNRLWTCKNLRQYIQRCSTTVSAIPGEITTPLISDLIKTLSDAASGQSQYTAVLRFGHAETLMPLLDQLRLPGCHYLTHYFDTVALHWCNFHVVPMASNLQLILCRGDSGCFYVITLLNERPVNLVPDTDSTLVPYSKAIEWLERCMMK